MGSISLGRSIDDVLMQGKGLDLERRGRGLVREGNVEGRVWTGWQDLGEWLARGE